MKRTIFEQALQLVVDIVSFSFFDSPFPPLGWRWMRSELLLVGLVEVWICSLL